MTSTDLVIPDPRSQPVPRGWWEEMARPFIDGLEDWEQLDELEARLSAIISYVETFEADAVEFTKALRHVEARRGQMLGPKAQGQRTDLQPSARVREVDASPDTQARWKTIAENWSTLEPVVREATEARQVSQARLLRLAGDGDPSANGHRRTSCERARDVIDGVVHDGPLAERCVAALQAAGCRFVFERQPA